MVKLFLIKCGNRKNYQLIVLEKCVIILIGDMNDSYTNYKFTS